MHSQFLTIFRHCMQESTRSHQPENKPNFTPKNPNPKEEAEIRTTEGEFNRK